MTTRDAKRPLITANMVTFARLIPMPILCWLVYVDKIWLALILGILIGCTDFVDGYLARKHGPTVLGGLMDPIADKVFIAFAYLPFADLGWVPTWAVALMFVREFLVTALRSAYEQRGLTMKTSYFAKVKTWTQMQGLGVILLIILLADHPKVIYGLLGAHIIAPLIAMGILWLVRRRFWPGALIMSLLAVPLIFLYMHGGVTWATYTIMIVVVAVTWLSGIDYVLLGLRELRGRGDIRRADRVRLVGAIALPCLIFATLTATPMPAWPLAAILAVELAAGGLDNLLSHHKVAAGALGYSARVLGTSLILASGLVLNYLGIVQPLQPLAIAAALVSITGVAIEFWRGRDYYLDHRLRNKSLSTANTP